MHAHRSVTRSRASTISVNVRPPTLARRLLFPHLPPGSDLPPLFLSPACPPDLNDEAYDLLALSLRAFVNTWWTKLTRYDKEFLPQITGVVTHVVHALEQRLLDADLALLVFGDIPALVTQHYKDYRQATSKASTSYATGGSLSVPQFFHQLQPHIALSSGGSIDEEYFRQAIDLILRECLPAEDYAPVAERFIVRELILKVVVKDVIPLITQPWFLQKMLLDVLGPFPDVLSEQPSVASTSRPSKSSVILLLLSAIQRLSGACIMLIHAYKQALHIIPIVNQSQSRSADTPDLTRGPLEMTSEVLYVQNRLAATALVQCLALFCRSFRMFMNKLLCYVLYTHVLSVSSMLTVLRLSKQTLFPNGYPGPPAVEPTPEAQVVIRAQLVQRIADWLPSVVLGDHAESTVELAVDAMSDAGCNRHLVVFLFDAIMTSVFPEMF